MDLDSMKYTDLRSLAKELGLKANGKADKLLKAIKHHYDQEKKLKELQGQDHVKVQEEDKNQVCEHSVQDGEDAACKEAASNVDMFVTTRRGKENAIKRKLNDPAADCDAKMTPKGDEKVDAQSKPCSAQGKKKRKMSSDKDSEQTGSAQESGSDQQVSYPQDEAPAGKGPKVLKGGRIPRYQRLQQKNKTNTPNFKKIHEAQFNKMESIETYVQRKTKQKETNRNSVKGLKEPSDKQKPEVNAGVKTNLNRASMFSPVPVNKKPAEEKGRQALQNKTAGKDVSFRPSVPFTRKTNVRFSEATRDNEFKGSLIKTPARMSPYITSSTPQKQTVESEKRHSVRISTFSAQKTPGPFIFTGNTSTLGTPGTQKMIFDLKASLSRPLTYKPHKGKLKPFGEVKENTSANKSLVSNTRQETYKQHKVQSREDRRIKQLENRKQKKESMLGARRGLVMK